MTNFSRTINSLARKGIGYSNFEQNGAKLLYYTKNGKHYNQVYDKAGKLTYYTIDNPWKGEKIVAEINRNGDNFTSIYKTRETPMGYFNHNVSINKNIEHDGVKFAEVKSTRSGSNGDYSELYTNIIKQDNGYYVVKDGLKNGENFKTEFCIKRNV